MPAKSVKHDLEPALKLIAANGIKLNLTKRSQEFIERIDAVGQYRYMEASFWVDWHWIVALDQGHRRGRREPDGTVAGRCGCCHGRTAFIVRSS